MLQYWKKNDIYILNGRYTWILTIIPWEFNMVSFWLCSRNSKSLNIYKLCFFITNKLTLSLKVLSFQDGWRLIWYHSLVSCLWDAWSSLGDPYFLVSVFVFSVCFCFCSAYARPASDLVLLGLFPCMVCELVYKTLYTWLLTM